jgi:hypothetical protein
MTLRITWIILLLLIILRISAQDSVVDKEHTKWIEGVLRSTQTIKPGMTREQLLRVFTTEGGLSTRLERTYVLKQCPSIKVTVYFLTVGNPTNLLIEMPEDTIEGISRPFLEFPTYN